MQEGKWDEAIQACESCLQVQPCLGRIHALMGECFYVQKMYEQAEPCFHRAYTLDPHLGDAASRHAQCLERLHRYRDAMDVVKDWLLLKPNDATLQGLHEFLLTQKESEEHDGWERTRRIGVTILNAGFGRDEPKTEEVHVSEPGPHAAWSKGTLKNNISLG